MRSISERDCAPLFTGRRIESSRNSLVSLRTASVVEMIAAFWAAPAAPAWAWVRVARLPAQRQTRISRATQALICFDILLVHSYSPLNVHSLIGGDSFLRTL